MSSASAGRPASIASGGERQADPPNAPRARGWPASWFLLAVVGMALLPSFLFSSVLLHEVGEAHETQREAGLLSRAQAMVHTIDLQIQDSITVLRILATTEALERADYKALHKRLQTALAGSRAHILVLDDKLQQIINTRVPYGTPLGKTADPRSSLTAVERRGPYVSTVFFGRVARAQVFDVVLPVFDGEEPRHILIMTRNTAWLAPVLERAEMPAEDAILVDQAGNIVATSQTGGSGEDEALHKRLAAATSAGKGGIGTVMFNGTSYRHAYHRSKLSGWHVVKYVPEAELLQPFDRSFTLLIGFTLLVLTACVLAAVWVARQVTQPLKALAGAVEEPDRHTFPRNTRIREINLAADALHEAAREREGRTAHVEFLMREMAHRVNNQFSVIEAIFRQTKKTADSEEKFNQAFVERLHGLSRSIAALSHGGWAAAPLRDLVREHVDRFADTGNAVVRLNGPSLRINPRAAESLGLALHELATNSLKYGALSAVSGRIAIDWCRSDDGERFTIMWREEVDTPVPPPSRQGFGSFVLREIVAKQLDGSAELRHGADGVAWRLECPWESMADVVRLDD